MPRLPKTHLVLLALLTLVQRLLFLGFRQFNLEHYEVSVIAHNILTGQGYRFNWEWQGSEMVAFGFPGMAYLLFLLRGLFGLADWPYIAYQLIVSIVSVWLIYALTFRLTQKCQWAFLAGLLLLLDPALTVYGTVKVHEGSMLVLLVLALSLISVDFLKAEPLPWKRVFLWGGLMGVGLFFRISLFWLAPALLLALMVPKPGLRSDKLRRLIVGSLIALWLFSPWILRNVYHLGHPVISTLDTFFLWRGNNPHATGSSLDRQGQTILQRSGFYEDTLDMGEWQRREFFGKKAKAWIFENPLRFTWLWLKKYFYFWWFSPQSGILYPPGWLAFYKIIYLGQIGLAAWGMGSLLSRGTVEEKRFLFFWIAFVDFVALFQSLFFVEGRHRLIALPLLAFLGAYPLTRMAQKIKAWFSRLSSRPRSACDPLP